VSYAIGVAEPTSVMVNVRHGPRVGREDHEAGARALRPAPEGHHPDARPAAPDLREDAAYGHFGREEPEFSWEATDKALALAEAAGVEPTARVA
jgi:S-adenosylmethionine synthetase